MRTRSRLILVTLALTIPLTAVACRNTGSDISDDQDSTDTTDNIDEPIRLEEYLGMPGFNILGFSDTSSDSTEMQDFQIRIEQKARELTAECMAREGFKYIPTTPPASIMFSDVDINSEEYARERGFGITTSYGEELSLYGEDSSQPAWTDPNEEIVNAMSESERQAYYIALYGMTDFEGFAVSSETETTTETDPTETNQTDETDPTETEETPETDPTETETTTETNQTDETETPENETGFFGEGCTGEAYAEAFSFVEPLMELDSKVESLRERFQADPEVQAIYTEWSQCMSEKGYTYENPDDLWNLVYEEFRPRLDEIVGSYSSLDLPKELLEDKSPEEIRDLYIQAEAEAHAKIDQEALAALQEEERSIAVANFKCSNNMNEKLNEISAEYETQFINQNRAVLDQFRDQLHE